MIRRPSVFIQLPGHEGDPTRLDQTVSSVITGPNGESLSAVTFTFGSLIRALGDKIPLDTVVHVVIDAHSSAQTESSADPKILSFNNGNLIVNAETREVCVGEVITHFPNKEFDLLYFLAANAHRVCTRAELLENIWGEEYSTNLRTNPLAKTLDVHVKRVRDKLSATLGTDCLVTCRSVGYRLSLTQDCTE